MPRSLFASRSSTVWPGRLPGQHGAHRALQEVMLFLEGTESPGSLGHRNGTGWVQVAGYRGLLPAGSGSRLCCTPTSCERSVSGG